MEDLGNFLEKSMGIVIGSSYPRYESPYNFKLVMDLSFNPSLKRLNSMILDFYKENNSEIKDGKMYLKEHNPPLVVKTNLTEIIDMYQFEVDIREDKESLRD